MASSRRPLLTLLSVIVAVAALWFWWRFFDVSLAELRGTIAAIDWRFIPLIIALLVGHVALSAYRWMLIEVGIGGRRPRFVHAFAAGGLALGLGTFLPAPIINVASRGLTNRMTGNSAVRGAVSGGFDQAADFGITALLAIPAGLALALGDTGIYAMGAPAMLIAGLLVISAVPRLARSAWLPAWARRFADLALFAQPAALRKVYGISVLRLANLSLITVMVGYACDAATIWSLLIAVPLVTLAISVAMLPGAFGASEWSFSAVLGQYGLGTTDVVRFVLANRVLLTLASLAIAVVVMICVVGGGLRRGGKAARLDQATPGS
jgi:hypothetical protein